MSRLACHVSAANAGGRLDDFRRIGDRQRLRDGTRQFRGAQDCERRARRETATFEKSDEAAHDRQAARHRAALDLARRDARERRGNRPAPARSASRGSAARRNARSGNRERRRGRGRRRRSCAARRAARRRASSSTARSPRADPRRRKTARAAPVPAGREKPAAAGGTIRGRSPRRSLTPADSAIARS